MHTAPAADESAQLPIDPVAARRFAAALEHAPAFICILAGPDHVIEFANQKYLQLVGGRTLLGKPVRTALPEIEGQGFFELLDEVFRSGHPYVGREVGVRIAQARGVETRYLNFVYQALSDAPGQTSGILVHGVDVTDMVVARHDLETRTRVFDTVLSSIVDFAYVFDTGGRFRFVNKALLDLWGLPLEQAIGKNFFDLGYPPELAERLQRQILQVVTTGERVTDETPYTSPTGQDGFYEYIFAPVLGADGRTVEAVAGSTRDISSRKRTERQLAEARQDAERLGQLKDDFLATLSHELRTPLSAILGWAHVLDQSRSTDVNIRKAIDAISRNARAQAQLIEDMLDLSRIEAGKIRLDVRRLDLLEVVAAAIESMVHAAAAKQIRIRTAFPPGPVTVSGDADRLQQVMWNLMTNAVKFTGANGTVTVAVRRRGAQIDTEVSDTGIGIPEAFIPFVFDRFRQGDASTTRGASGLGIGLAVVKQLVTLHGGTVTAASAGEGCGATFVVTLPESLGVPLQYLEPSQRGPREGPAADTPSFSLDGVTVLVVDDDPDTRALASRFLGELGARVVTVADVDSAMREIARDRPQVALCDIHMPGEDGYRFLARLRAEGLGDALPVVAFSAFARPEDRDRALAAGFRHYLTKPVVPGELTRVVARTAGRAT
jgi:PAS domain S-box-containing protein